MSEDFGALQAKSHASAVLIQLIVSFGAQDGHELKNSCDKACYHVNRLLDDMIKSHGGLKSIESFQNSIELKF